MNRRKAGELTALIVSMSERPDGVTNADLVAVAGLTANCAGSELVRVELRNGLACARRPTVQVNRWFANTRLRDAWLAANAKAPPVSRGGIQVMPRHRSKRFAPDAPVTCDVPVTKCPSISHDVRFQFSAAEAKAFIGEFEVAGIAGYLT